MIPQIKNQIRLLLNFLHLDITKNLEYDRLTKVILKKVLTENSNCIDVGCHKGEILDLIIKFAPKGHHTGFEPIPTLYNSLKQKYEPKSTILPYALSHENGHSTFQFVKNAPAYSGLKQRKYAVENPDIEEIHVELKKLDDIIPTNQNINLIKIDVEGAEYGVLLGAINLIKRNKPFIIFEFGLGASDFYGTKPEQIFDFFQLQAGMKISTLKHFLQKEPQIEKQNFVDLFNSNKEYYFIAYE